MLNLAARAALRAAGNVEPNPMVGCVLWRDGRIIGIGHHQFFGGPHAEVNALADCAHRGHSPAGATAFVTLEPCSHFGKQPPCCDALIRAQVARVICARPDPSPVSTGGAAKLIAAGIPCEYTNASPLATRLSDPFHKRITRNLPWVIAKWAQTIDGRIATRAGASQWISSEASRREVHRLRARVDCILTAIGTVLADDPQLTARGVHLRRAARRIIIDPRLELPPASKLLQTLPLAPLTIATTRSAIEAKPDLAQSLASRGVELLPADSPGAGPDEIDLRAVLSHLAHTHDATNVLIEPGPRLLGRLLEQDLADELRIYIGPLALGDELAAPAAAGRSAPALADARRFQLLRARPLGPDVRLLYRRM
jgi:diaminohydroxyphosphoribosylaminopyrimidine deaminase/5-amino-6-(5-phosphoribosylamino)uracil reductase